MLLLLVALAGCGGDEAVTSAADAGVELTAGQTLLDHVDRWHIASHPLTDLPPDVAVQGAVRATDGRVVVQPDDWVEGEVVPAPFRLSLELTADARVFRAAPQVGFRPGEEEPVLEHGGHRLEPWRLPGTNHLWRDDVAELIFWWDTANAQLLAIGHWPPGDAVLTQGSPESDVPLDADPGRAAVPADPALLRHRLTVGRSSRPGFLVPAPSELALPVKRWEGDQLQLVVSVAERVYRRDDAGRVLQKIWNELPVRFSVDVDLGGERRSLWSREITAAEGFVSDRVDLSGLPPEAVTLRLKAEPTKATGGSWPYAFWSDLAFTGTFDGGGITEGRPHVVLIDVDTLRADRLGMYGADRETSPRLDDWAARHATVYTDSLAASNWTLPSTASMLTGLTVQQHGMLAFPKVLGDSTPTLATRLRHAGYQTMAMVEGGYVSSAFGFDQGFDRFDQVPFQNPQWHEVLDWLGGRRDPRPVFLFLQTYFVHAPWRADPRFDDPVRPYDGPLAGRDVTHDAVIKPYEAGRLPLDDADKAYVNDLYDASVARLDEYLVDFLEDLDRYLPPGERLLIITSDHGEELFTRGQVEHGSTLFGELLEVPLMVQYPDRNFGTTETVPASGLDLVPTVLHELGLPVPAELPGHPLRKAMKDARARVAQHADKARAVQFQGWKLLVGDVRGNDPSGALDDVQLYDLHADPGETDDIAEAVPEWVRRLRGMLDEFDQTYRPLGPRPGEEEMDGAVIDDLRQMGYLGDR